MYKKSKILNDKLNIIFETILNHYTHAIAVVQDGDKWLLGRANTDDERDNKWCMPGGGMKKGESPEDAAVRECREETGVKCEAVHRLLPAGSNYRNFPNVAFVYCKATSPNQKLSNNSEFYELGFFNTNEIESLELYNGAQIKKLIKRAIPWQC
jgi:8-oxo-dGTP pyrophosphatase MutT (NUDIX family)